jgi:hypothetical protein
MQSGREKVDKFLDAAFAEITNNNANKMRECGCSDDYIKFMRERNEQEKQQARWRMYAEAYEFVAGHSVI